MYPDRLDNLVEKMNNRPYGTNRLFDRAMGVSSHTVSPGQSHTPSRRILVVDDDDLLLEVAQMSLEVVGGWAVVTASRAQDGIVRARAEHPDAIVLDVMMAGMDGPTAAKALRADPATADIPIVLLTAKVQTADRDAFAGLPVAGVLAKPFDPMRLPADLAALLGWS